MAANGHAFDPSRLRVLRETSHRCSAGVGKQAFPDALIGVELPVHNRLGVMITAGVASTGRAVFAG